MKKDIYENLAEMQSDEEFAKLHKEFLKELQKKKRSKNYKISYFFWIFKRSNLSIYTNTK